MANYETQSECKTSMEQECLIERNRNITLKECSDIVKYNNTTNYTRELFKKLFQNEVTNP